MRKVFILFSLFVLAACGGNADQTASDANGAADGSTTESGLSQSELEHGIGPIQELSLGAVDEQLAAEGAEIFKTKCSACHKFDARYVGPPLADVLEQRTPEYVMNMMLNPEEMLQKHPEARAMLAEYMTPMPNQQLTESDARSVLEYIRQETSGTD